MKKIFLRLCKLTEIFQNDPFLFQSLNEITKNPKTFFNQLDKKNEKKDY